MLFVLKRSFDYSEFVRMVEERELPKGLMGHARTKGSEAYACIAAPSDADAKSAGFNGRTGCRRLSAEPWRHSSLVLSRGRAGDRRSR